jgi:Flp pilus assembly protein TadB
MSASRLTWFVALWGALWTWFLASWSGISLSTSLLRAATVFVMLAAVMIVLQVLLNASRTTRQPAENRPASEEPPAPEEPQEEREAA